MALIAKLSLPIIPDLIQTTSPDMASFDSDGLNGRHKEPVLEIGRYSDGPPAVPGHLASVNFLWLVICPSTVTRRK